MTEVSWSKRNPHRIAKLPASNQRQDISTGLSEATWPNKTRAQQKERKAAEVATAPDNLALPDLQTRPLMILPTKGAKSKIKKSVCILNPKDF
jgi:hypothetical protein